ncbi:hypothetical protein [Variovorax sp. dw_954]|uniref:hypothetical protein n=1 Tax=Variovorax sp. dw_954 TaxID=2720078 RepID=UPI001BD1FE4C|nr:hypothetical protein [Variovorax sp. dw_954]
MRITGTRIEQGVAAVDHTPSSERTSPVGEARAIIALLNSPAMRRWLSLFMLVLLPLLSSWSAAAAYCGDEPIERPAHVAHHVDAHHDDDQGGSNAGASEAHCDHCHSPGAMLLLVVSDGHRAGAGQPAPWSRAALRAPPASPPDRPKWARLA